MLMDPGRLSPFIPAGRQNVFDVKIPIPALNPPPKALPLVVIPLIEVLLQFVRFSPLPVLLVEVILVRTQLSEPYTEIPVPPQLLTVTFVRTRLSAPQSV